MQHERLGGMSLALQGHGRDFVQKEGYDAAQEAPSLKRCLHLTVSSITIRTMSGQKPTPSTGKRKACKRYNVAGDAHGLTFNCFRRQAFLNRDRCRNWLIDAIQRAQRLHCFDVWAYCIMPEHFHMLIWFRQPGYDVSDILKSIKLSVAKQAVSFVRREAPAFLKRMTDRQPNGRLCYRFWQRGGGYDRNLSESKAIYQQIDYIHNNPVRRGLCERAEDWLWSSAADYVGIRKGPLPLQLESLPPLVEFS
jgi:putative transposase